MSLRIRKRGPRPPHPAEHNLIQRPELIRDLQQRMGVRQAHVAPTLQEGVQPVIVLDDLTRAPSALGRRASMHLDGALGTAASVSCVALWNQPTSTYRLRILAVHGTINVTGSGGAARQLEMVMVPAANSIAALTLGGGALANAGAMDLDTCVGFDQGHAVPLTGTTDAPFAASWAFGEHQMTWDEAAVIGPDHMTRYTFPSGGEPVLKPGTAAVLVVRIPGAGYAFNANTRLRRAGFFWREEPAAV